MELFKVNIFKETPKQHSNVQGTTPVVYLVLVNSSAWHEVTDNKSSEYTVCGSKGEGEGIVERRTSGF